MPSMRDFATKQETKIAEFLGWERVSGSGAAPCVPGDVIADDWLGECKTHTSPDQRIFFDYEVWKKINEEAMAKRRSAVLFADDGSQNTKRTWAVCNYVSIERPFLLEADLPFAVRKNISFDGAKQKGVLAVLSAKNVSPLSMFKYIVFRYTWNDSDVALMPLDTFKELINA